MSLLLYKEGTVGTFFAQDPARLAIIPKVTVLWLCMRHLETVPTVMPHTPHPIKQLRIIFSLDVNALLFTHCFALLMHTMGECVSALFSNRYNSVLCYLSLHLPVTVYKWMYCSTGYMYGYVLSIHFHSGVYLVVPNTR